MIESTALIAVLQIVLAGFTGMLAWFLKELWVLHKEELASRANMQERMEEIDRSMITSCGLMREMIGELRLELAKDYVTKIEANRTHEEFYTRIAKMELQGGA